MNFETTPHFCYFLLSFNPPFYILKPLVYKDFASYLERETKSRTFSSCIALKSLILSYFDLLGYREYKSWTSSTTYCGKNKYC